MAVIFNDSILVQAPKATDDRYSNAGTPYTSTSAAISVIPGSVRYQGLTINVNGVEYWWGSGVSDGNLVTKYNYLSLSGGTLTGPLVLDADPTLSNQAATKNYVDNAFIGLAWKTPADVATTSNITLSGEQTIDGIVTSTSRILVKNQTTTSQNGVYTSSSGSWTRTADTNTAALINKATISVKGGTANANTIWTQSATVTTINTDPVSFVQVSGIGAYNAGTGLNLSGNTFSISSTYIGQSSITTLGTITTGTWAGTTITVPNGGTNTTSFTPYSIIAGGTTSTSALQSIGNGISGYPLLSQGSSAVPAYAQLDLTFGVTNILPISNGGTGASTASGALANIGAQGTLTLTTTGTTGAATFVGNTLNIPNYSATGVTSFNTRTGVVTLLNTDIDSALKNNALSLTGLWRFNLTDTNTLNFAGGGNGGNNYTDYFQTGQLIQLVALTSSNTGATLTLSSNYSDLAYQIAGFETNYIRVNSAGINFIAPNTNWILNGNNPTASGQVPTWNGTTMVWATGSGGGTTTNPITFNNSGSGASSGSSFNGSLATTISYNTIGAQPLFGNQTANTVYAGPATGSSALPSFRALTVNDIPDIPPTSINGSTIGYVLLGNNAGTGLWGQINLSNNSSNANYTGILPVGSGGTGATTLTGILKGNGTSALTTATAGTDYLIPFGSQTANFVYASPNGSSGNPAFRAIVVADIPTLNQNTTGSAATLTTSRNFQTNLASTSAASFNGSADNTHGVTGLLADANIASASNWNTAYSNRIISLTTIGTSGTATLSSNTLNIPNYTLSGLGGWSLNNGGTLSGANTITSTLANSLTFSSTGTTTANNQSAFNFNGTHTMRATANDVFSFNNINLTATLGSTNQKSSALTINVTPIQTGPVTAFTNTNLVLTGSTVGTYTNVSPSSTSGSGTGLLVTVTVTSPTQATVAITYGGSNYSVNDVVTFNGSLFGGSGTASLNVYSVSGVSFQIGAGAQQINVNNNPALSGGFSVPNYLHQSYFSNGTFVGGIGYGSSGVGVVDNVNNLIASWISNTFTINASTFTIRSSTVNLLNGYNYSGTTGTTAGRALSVSGGTNLSATNNYALNNSIYVNYGSIQQGWIQTATLGGTMSGYTVGAAILSGGSGSGATINITTVSSGAITAYTFTQRGSNYKMGDVLTIVQTGGSGGTLTTTAIDYANHLSAFNNITTYNDASSNNKYFTYKFDGTWNITSTQTGLAGFIYYNPTVTNIGSFQHSPLLLVPTGTTNGIGTATPTATLQLVGSGSTTTFKTVGAGTGTNLSWAGYDSSGTNLIASLKDNGDFQVGLTTSKLGFFGTAAIAQITTAVAAASFTANTGNAVNDASTFDGYTLKQLVKALRNYGILQ